MHGITDTLNYKNIANAIREKNGSQEVYKPSEMASAIENLYKNNPLVNAIENSTIFSDTDKQNLKELALNTASNANDIVYYKTNLEEHHGIIIVDDKNCVTPYDNAFLDCDILVLDCKGKEISSNSYNFISNCQYIYLLSDIRLSRGCGSCFINTNLKKIIQNEHTIYLMYNSLFSAAEMFMNCMNLEELPNFTFSENFGENVYYTEVFVLCKKIKKITKKNIPTFKSIYASSGSIMCSYCFNLQIFEPYCSINRGYNSFLYCYKLHSIGELDFLNNDNTTSTFDKCYSLVNVSVLNWVKFNLSFADSPNLSIESINRLIENCDKDGGTQVARTLTLHATAGARWADENQNPRYSELLSKANQCLIQIIY